MSIGLGYVAKGLMQGRQQNINDSLRRNEEERRQMSFGLQQRIGEADAKVKEHNSSDHNLGLLDRRNTANTEQAEAQARTANFQSSDGYLDTLYRGVEAGVTGKQLNNQYAQQGIDLRGEQLTPEAKALRQKEQNFKASELERREAIGKMDLRIKQRNEELLQLTHLNDKARAQQERQKLTDIDAYETINRLRQGDKSNAIRLFNELDSNGIYDATDLSFDDAGNLYIARRDNEDIIYPAEAIKGIEQRIQAEIERTSAKKAPKVYKEKVFNEAGVEVGEKAYVLQHDPATNKQYKQYIEEKPQQQAQVDANEEIQVALEMVRDGELSAEMFEKWYGIKPPSDASQGANTEFADDYIPPDTNTTTTVDKPKGLGLLQSGIKPRPLAR
ncbi:hypothetical protein DN730_08160 [Marinomonas piezotolerans]|uniref:Uncharacterized protein n=1 Tax=Marinomonas piezotolerans TaxID=2213058 RepID=A0A370U9D7_9GAMM|nr:hypothetical protein [Marinomonas piezotolerans]RDL44368.1 hypothetical protein DN730_08160 [Marinomonas piezotolerans]